MNNGQVEQRATKRRLVGLPAECSLGIAAAQGIVRDVTRAGAFIASGRERDRSGVGAPLGSALERLLRVGDRFMLTFIQTTVMNRHLVPATVRWEGISAEHGCHGYGVQYE